MSGVDRYSDFDAAFAEKLKEFGTVDRLVEEYSSYKMKCRELEGWKQAVIDAAVINWTLTKENKDDPRKAINDLLVMAEQQALDPLISKPAAELHNRIKELEEKLNDTRQL